MEGEDFPGPWFGVSVIGEAGDGSRAFVGEEEFFVVEVFKFGGGVSFCLVFVGDEVLALFRPLGFDHSYWFLVHEEDVVGRAGVGLVFPDGYSDAGVEVETLLILDEPAGCFKMSINYISGYLFRIFIWGHVNN